MNSLDQSHRTLLENIATFRLAERCLADTEVYVKGFLEELVGELGSRYRETATVGFKVGCLQLDAFPNWRGSECHFVSIGLENIKVANLLAGAGGEPCRAYIWSAYLSTQSNATTPEGARLRSLASSTGFGASRRSGYLAEKDLGLLTVDQMMSRDEVRRYFSVPLNHLAGWLDENWAAITSLVGNETTRAPINS